MKALSKSAASVALLTLLPVIGSCSSDSGQENQIVIQIGGNWTLAATLHQDQGSMTCQITDLNMAIEMLGNTGLFGGQTLGGHLSCTDGDNVVFEEDLPGFQIGAGTESNAGSEVSFNLSEGGMAFEGDNTFLTMEGSLSGTRMEGQALGFLVLDDPDNPLAFEGTFVNVRTST